MKNKLAKPKVVSVVQICEKNEQPCDGKPYKANVGKKKWVFCCEKGFKQSLVDFQNFLNKS